MLRQEYEELKQSFKHELASKRLAQLGLSERQNLAYLSAGLAREQECLNLLHNDMRKTMESISAKLNLLDNEERYPLTTELNSLSERVNEQALKARARKEAVWADAAGRQTEALHEVGKSPIEDAALKAVRKFLQWETFLGLKIISALGALLILFGVFTFGAYLYSRIGPAFQCAVIFILGLALMGAALGYMTLGVLPMGVALGICAAVSLLTFFAAMRYNAQLVAVFALIGGYLPIFALNSGFVLYGALYFTILNIFALAIATRKNWRPARFFGLFAGLIAEAVLIASLPDRALETGAVGAAIGVAFIAYLIIPVFGAWFTKTCIIVEDIVLLSCNVVFRFILGLVLFQTANALSNASNTYNLAFVAAFFALCCIVMAFITERQKHNGVPESETGSLRALFFITGVSFSALIVLFALDKMWFSAGWLVEAAGLALYGILKDRRRFLTAGAIIGVCCLFAFLLFNVTDYKNPLFVWQYLLITLAAAAVALATLRLKTQKQEGVWGLNILRAVAAFNVWLYAIYVLQNPLQPALTQWLGDHAASFAALAGITLGFLFSFLLPRIRRVYNHGFQAAAIAAGVVSVIWLLAFNAGAAGLAGGGSAIGVAVFALYVIVNIVGIAWINDLLRFTTGLKKLPLRWYPLLLSGYAMLMAAQNMVVQLSLKPSSLILTLLFGLTALGWVVFGFIKRNDLTRISGLAMAFFAVIKLFVLDLYGLPTTWRIVSYFTGGVVLLAISFVYQWFNKRLAQSEKTD